MDDADESMPVMNADVEADIKELIGLFDLPAFARRGQDLEITLRRLNDRCTKARADMLDMVRARLRQWSHAVTGPTAWSTVFSEPIEPLWTLAHADPPRWAQAPAPFKRQVAIAQDLIASVIRFNMRWNLYLGSLNLEPANQVIDQYNRYYVLEKECVMGSARLAARHFVPVPAISARTLLSDHPALPVPRLNHEAMHSGRPLARLSSPSLDQSGSHDENSSPP